MASSYLPFPAALRPLPPFSSSNLLKQITNIHNWQQEYNCRKWLFDIFSGWRVGWRLHSTGQKITQIQLRNERKSGHTRHIRHSIKLNGSPERWCDIFLPPPLKWLRQVAPLLDRRRRNCQSKQIIIQQEKKIEIYRGKRWNIKIQQQIEKKNHN